MKLRSPYNYDREQASVSSGLACLDKTLTQQHQKEDADINVIVRRFGVTGQIPVLDRVPVASDFDGIFDYQTAMNAVVEAQRSFAALPSDVRNRFANDPQRFVEFCSDEKNVEELRRMGLAKPAAEPPASPPDPTPKA